MLLCEQKCIKELHDVLGYHIHNIAFPLDDIKIMLTRIGQGGKFAVKTELRECN